MKTLPKLIRISRLYQGPSLGGSIVVMGVTGSWSGGGGRVKAVQGGWVLPSTDQRCPVSWEGKLIMQSPFAFHAG